MHIILLFPFSFNSSLCHWRQSGCLEVIPGNSCLFSHLSVISCLSLKRLQPWLCSGLEVAFSIRSGVFQASGIYIDYKCCSLSSCGPTFSQRTQPHFQKSCSLQHGWVQGLCFHHEAEVKEGCSHPMAKGERNMCMEEHPRPDAGV